MRQLAMLRVLVGLILATTVSSADAAFNVVDSGAVGDGVTVNTAAIQSSIDACASGGGGTVLFPAGRFVTGTLFLKDKVCLHLESGAVILGSTHLDDYPIIRCEYPSKSDSYTARALIWGEGLTNVAITGFGTIDGQGASFHGKKATPEEMKPHSDAYAAEGRHTPEAHYFNRPYLIRLISCRDVRVHDVTLQNSAMWMQHYLNCEHVSIRGIKVFNHVAANNDMIDIDGCRYVTIADCYGDTDDDALTLKSTGAAPTEHVTITNCILASHCNALKAGTESAGGFKDIAITNCVIKRSAVEPALSGRDEGLAGIALEIVDGGTLDGVVISNVVIQDTTAPIFLRLGDRGRPARKADPKPAAGTFRNVIISNIVARGASATGCAIAGVPGHPIEDVILENIRIEFAGGGTAEQAARAIPEEEPKYPESTMFGALPAYGFYVRHADGITLRNIQLECATPDARPAITCDDVQNIQLESVTAKASPDAAPARVTTDMVQNAPR
jgi:polygalacturonase